MRERERERERDRDREKTERGYGESACSTHEENKTTPDE
jgi:hypothetical protein